ncbi:hypothetical protein CGZ91_04600 [Parenemella sanctibonifatiensis]|uniref:Uncharacterized protein n=1 Tax=Parenemella sanctibonifatiensis TaxID=2016505 RepID=A0A255EML1_9ACTN|nr:hypothetical protein CGZ91_04600 [Parenemella sanctibonifatiensis]
MTVTENTPTGPVTSDVTVDPGDIRDFAKFLDEMTTELQGLNQRVDAFKAPGSVGFGKYNASAGAEQRFREAINTHSSNLNRMVTRNQQLTSGSNELAKQYTDLNALNALHSVEVHNAIQEGPAQ